MSVRALTWSFNLRLEDMAAKAALHALSDHADEEGRCWPSVTRIARFAGCNDKTARRALQRLADLGLIARESRAGQSDVYTIDFDWTPPKSTPPNAGDGQIDYSQSDPPPLPSCPDPPPKLTEDPSQRGSRTVKNRQFNRQGTPNEQPAKLRPDWKPSQAGRDFATDRGLDPGNVAERFADHFTNNARGKREKRTDEAWERRWRIWCTTDAERRPAHAISRPGRDDGSDPIADGVRESLARRSVLAGG